jgi:uncharacterized protein (DUF1501 family)
MKLPRRIFLKNSALAMVGVGALPAWLARSAYAATGASGRRKILVAIFQRGAADGLNVVVPYGEARYYSLRPSIAIPRPSGALAGSGEAIDLDGFFGLHPALSPLKPLWDDGHLAVVHAAGSPDPTRSHFDAQDFMESGTPGVKATDDGWLNRAIAAETPAGNPAARFAANRPRTTQRDSYRPAVPPLWQRSAPSRIAQAQSPVESRAIPQADSPTDQQCQSGARGERCEDAGREEPRRGSATSQASNRPRTTQRDAYRPADPPSIVSPLRAVSMTPEIPRSLQGRVPAIAIGSLDAFRVGFGPQGVAADDLFEQMYDHTADAVLRPAGQDTFEALAILKNLEPRSYRPAPGADYPRAGLGNSLRQLAQLIKADVGVEVAFADVGGWDHHVNEGSVQGQLAARLRELGQSLNAFWTDLGPRAEDVVVVTMSEFGRAARENGNGGTDHGHANVMFVLGGPVRGRRVAGRWPGMSDDQLYQARDLAVTTDFRDVLAEVVSRHLGVADLAQVFPGFNPTPRNWPGVVL